jgi:hypothetical protein
MTETEISLNDLRPRKPAVKAAAPKPNTAEGPLMPSIPPVHQGYGSNDHPYQPEDVLRKNVTWTRPQPTTSGETGLKIDPQVQYSDTVNWGPTGALQYSSTDKQPQEKDRAPGDPAQTSQTATPRPPVDNRMNLLGQDYTKATPGKQIMDGPGKTTVASWPPKLASPGQSSTITQGFDNNAPSGTGLQDQPDESHLLLKPRRPPIVRRD